MPLAASTTPAVSAAIVALLLGATPALADDVSLPTAQATAMHAEFLTQAPTPATPGGTCVIDTGVNANPVDIVPALCTTS